MFSLVLSSVRHNVGRYIATLVAIMTGVGFYTAVSFISDRVIDSLEGNVDDQYGAVSVAVAPGDVPIANNSTADEGPLRIPQRAVDRLLDLPGVEAGAGIVTAPVGFLGDDGKAFATGASGRLWVEDEALNPLDVEEGSAPEAAGEIAVDRGLAEDEGLSVGQEVTLLTVGGREPATIVGITRFGDSDSLDDSGTVSISEVDAFDWLNSGHRTYETYYLRGDDGPELVDAVSAELPRGFEAQSGAEFRDDQRAEAGSIGTVLRQGLQAFAILALLVGGFVIYNTFSVIVAQRLRELAVLAAIGATPRQLKRSLRTEGFVIGLLGSALGVVTGFVITLLLDLVVRATGNTLPGSATSIHLSNVLNGIVLGTVITVLSVMLPARRAARTEPIEAMRDAAVESNELSRVRGAVSLALVVLGIAGMSLGSGALTIGGGVIAFMAGLFTGAPHIAKVGARLARPLLSRLGLEGRLAVDNSIRNPKRTATTSNALLIGVFLVTLVGVAGTSVKDFAVGALNEVESADYVVTSTGGTVDDDLVADFADVPDVEEVVPFRRAPVLLEGTPNVISAGDVDAMAGVASLDTTDGSLDDLTDGTIALQGLGPQVGDTLTVEDTDGEEVSLEVVAILEGSLDASQVGSIVDEATFESLVGDVAPTAAFIDVASGAQTETKRDIEDIAALRPDITVQHGNAVGELIGGIFDFLIKGVTALLLMSVVIALIGIVNTMSLSILERRRELGLLRIIGMTDAKVRRMVTLESVLISVLGTVSGLVSGLVVSLLLVASIGRLSDAPVAASLPVLELVLILVTGVVLGVLAALIPARRSTKLSELEAIASA